MDTATKIREMLTTISNEFEQGSRIAVKAGRIIEAYKNYEYYVSFTPKTDRLNIALEKEILPPFPLDHEAKVLQIHYNDLHYKIMKHHHQVRTPLIVKKLIETLLAVAKEQAGEAFEYIKRKYESSEYVRVPTYKGGVVKKTELAKEIIKR